nr:hypothetical protein [Tanacetum cinerariifolium]
MWETNSYKAHEDHMMLYEALEKSMKRDNTDELLKDLTEARKKKKKRRDSPKTPPGSPPHQPPPPLPPANLSRTLGSSEASGSSQVPPPPPPPLSTNQEGQSHGSKTPSSSKTAASAEYKAWTMTDTRIRPFVSSTPEDLHMDAVMAPDAQVHSSDDEDIRNAYILKVNLRQDWWKPLEEDRPATPEPAWFIPSSDLPILKNNWASTLASTYLPPPEDSLLAPTLSISKMKAAYYPDVGLEQMVPDQMWIEEECKDKYGVQMIMRFNEIHKFSDDTLHQIDEALDYQVKEFKVNRMNPSLNIRFWIRKDVDRSKEFMFAIQKRLKTRRIFCNLESFIGGRVAVCSSLRSLKPKCTIESRAKRSSKIISLGYYSIILASSHTMKSKTDIKSPTHYPRGIARTSE